MILHSEEALMKVVNELRKAGKKIITTNGCFDIMHPEHIQNFREGRALGDILIVLVNSDANPYFQSKPGRPINTEESRMIMLDAIRYIDYVYAFSMETPILLLERIKPDIHIKGGGYVKEDLPEYAIVKKYGGDVAIIPTIGTYTTTNIIEKILKVYADK